MRVQSVPCRRCRRQNHPQQTHCAYCGAWLAAPLGRHALLILPAVLVAAAVAAWVISLPRQPAELAITWDSLAGAKAAGRIHNLGAAPIRHLAIYRTTSGVARSSRWPEGALFAGWPHPLRQRDLEPGEEAAFELEFHHVGSLPFPTHVVVENREKAFRYTEYWEGRRHAGP